MSFGGDCAKDTGSFVSAVKHAVAAMVDHSGDGVPYRTLSRRSMSYLCIIVIISKKD
jgi:hypothetical protein